MKKNQILFFAILTLIVFSCKKDPTNVGVNIQPSSDLLIVEKSDSSTFSASTIIGDSISTDSRSLSLFGRINDPVFGISTADFVTQFRIEDNNLFFGTAPQANKIVLFLDYGGFYGDTTQPQKISVYKLIKDIYYDSTYYSNCNLSALYDNLSPLADTTFYPQPNDTALAIPLSSTLAQEFLNADTSNFRNNDNFISFFKGLAVVCDSSEGQSILYFNFMSGKSLLRMYYTNAEDGATHYDFVLNNNCERINKYTHNYSGTDVETSLNDTTSTKVYIQSMGGVKTKLKFELPDEIKSKNIAINKAQLILTADDKTLTQSDIYPVPDALLIELIDDNDGFDAPIDYYLSSDYFNGKYDAETNSYTFNLTRYIQRLVNKEVENNGFYIISSGNKISANRLVVLNSGKNKIRLKLFYTNLNK